MMFIKHYAPTDGAMYVFTYVEIFKKLSSGGLEVSFSILSYQGDSSKYPKHMILWRNIEKNSLFVNSIPTPDFPHFHYI